MPKSARIAAAPLFTLMAAAAFLFIVSGCQKEAGRKYSGPVEKVTFGVASIDASSLVYIAQARGMFADQGLDISMVEYTAGVIAADDLLQDQLDVVTATEFVVVNKQLLHPDVRVLASIARPDSHEVIARKDRGITEPAHLKGKRIAVTRNSSGDFFLGTFLTHHGIPLESVTYVDLPPPKILTALSSGAVDAAMTWEPTVAKIKERLGPNAVHWPGQSGRGYYMVLMTREDFIKKRPAAAERLIGALLDAEKYASEHTPEAQELIARQLGYDPVLLQSIWRRCDFRVRLDQDLLLLMEDEARWTFRQRQLKQEMPNYLAIIHWESLKKMKPEAVSIIH
jgi:NitT/TauT family transport system substrate-binding protein